MTRPSRPAARRSRRTASALRSPVVLRPRPPAAGAGLDPSRRRTLQVGHRAPPDVAVTIAPVVPMFHVNAWGLPYAACMVGAKVVFPGPTSTARRSTTCRKPSRSPCRPACRPCGRDNSTTCSSTTAVHHPAARGHRRCRVPPGDAARTRGDPRRHGRARVGHDRDEPLRHRLVSSRTTIFRRHPSSEPCRASRGDASSAWTWRSSTTPDANCRGTACRGSPDGPGALGASRYFGQTDTDPLVDGWFPTGDIATIDPDGYMQITDRSKDVIKSGGEWISSIDIENVAMATPKSPRRPASVCATPSGTSVPCWSRCRDPAPTSPPRNCSPTSRARWPNGGSPTASSSSTTMPLTATGKVRRLHVAAALRRVLPGLLSGHAALTPSCDTRWACCRPVPERAMECNRAVKADVVSDCRDGGPERRVSRWIKAMSRRTSSLMAWNVVSSAARRRHSVRTEKCSVCATAAMGGGPSRQSADVLPHTMSIDFSSAGERYEDPVFGRTRQEPFQVGLALPDGHVEIGGVEADAGGLAAEKRTGPGNR